MNNNLLYHYTSADSFVGMINGGKGVALKDHAIGEECVLSFWANSVYTMNDPSEMMYGYEIVKQMIEKADTNKILTSYYNQIVVEDWSEEYKRAFFKEHFFNVEKTPFAISFSHNDSEEDDNEELFMWSMYGDSGRGFRLGFDEDAMAYDGHRESGIKAFPVCYDEKSFEDIYYPLLQQQVKAGYKDLERLSDPESIIWGKVSIIASVFTLFCSLIKNPKYRKEKEWRIVCFSNSTSFPDVIFRTRNSLIIPYVERLVPIKYLKEIIVGPCCNYELQKRNVEMILKSCGVDIEMIRISKSTIPYRNM